MLPGESKFDAKFLFMVLIEKFSGRAPSRNLSLKAPVLVGLITK